MNDINTLTAEVRSNLVSYKNLEIAQQNAILSAIGNLLLGLSSENPPDQTMVTKILTDTGNFDIALSCYMAELFGVPWMY